MGVEPRAGARGRAPARTPGRLVARPRHGFAVRTISVQEIDDLFEVRISLELTAIELACRKADDAGLARLQALVDTRCARRRCCRSTARIALDLGFHTLICELSGNAQLHRIFSNMQTEMCYDHRADRRAVRRPEHDRQDALSNRRGAAEARCSAATAAVRVHLADAWKHVRALSSSSTARRLRQPPPSARVDEGAHAMKVAYSDAHQHHDPQLFMVRGKLKRSNEQPERALRLLARSSKPATKSLPRPTTARARARPFTRPSTCAFSKRRTRAGSCLMTVRRGHAQHPPVPRPALQLPRERGRPGRLPHGDNACSIGAHTWAAATASAHLARTQRSW
jgi:DNA-binding GntR family transcriptional regulator